MPIYEFKCEKCGRMTIKRYPINSNIKKVECKECNGKANKIISQSTFRVNGYSFKNGYSKGEK